jgi:hypothetical protein
MPTIVLTPPLGRQSGRGERSSHASSKRARYFPQAIGVVDLRAPLARLGEERAAGLRERAALPADLEHVGELDAVEAVVAKFADGKLDPDHWVGVIEKLAL